MSLNKNFPLDPTLILDPNIRWFPGDKALGDKGREKLLPPLVNNIRKGVFDWRLKGYPGISDVTKSLLNFWFNFDHKNNFKYYLALLKIQFVPRMEHGTTKVLNTVLEVVE